MKKSIGALTTAVTLSICVTLPTATAQPAPPQPGANQHTPTYTIPRGGAEYVALGDSYAGNPTTREQFESRSEEERCRHGDNSYPVRVASRFNSFANFSCSGAVIVEDSTEKPRVSNMPMLIDRAEQAGALGPNTKVVTITIGGNEAWLGYRDYGLLGSPAIITPDEYFRRLSPSMARVRALAPHARILLVGYPEVVGSDDMHCLVDTNRWGFPVRIAFPASNQRAYNIALNRAMELTAPLMTAEYVDVFTGSQGHGSCAPDNQRYIKTMLDAPERDDYLPLHLNEAGTKFQADVILHHLDTYAPPPRIDLRIPPFDPRLLQLPPLPPPPPAPVLSNLSH